MPFHMYAFGRVFLFCICRNKIQLYSQAYTGKFKCSNKGPLKHSVKPLLIFNHKIKNKLKYLFLTWGHDFFGVEPFLHRSYQRPLENTDTFALRMITIATLQIRSSDELILLWGHHSCEELCWGPQHCSRGTYSGSHSLPSLLQFPANHWWQQTVAEGEPERLFTTNTHFPPPLPSLFIS